MEKDQREEETNSPIGLRVLLSILFIGTELSGVSITWTITFTLL